MDSITHITLGACIGESFFKRGYGKKAMLWGALAQSIPDIDFISAAWQSTSEHLLSHRGFTHSLLFAVLIVPLLAGIAFRIHSKDGTSYIKWMAFFSLEILIHLFLDSLNNYGIGVLIPFNDHRFSFNLIFVADPLFTIAPLVFFTLLLIRPVHLAIRKKWWKLSLIFPGCYLLLCLVNKILINNKVNNTLSKGQRYFTTPAPFQSFLWFVTAETSNGFLTGYASVFDKADTVNLNRHQQGRELAGILQDKTDFEKLEKFSQGYYILENRNDSLLFYDLRFGQIHGWSNDKARFVFYYILYPESDNTMVVQRGRFEGWNRETMAAYFKRIAGN